MYTHALNVHTLYTGCVCVQWFTGEFSTGMVSCCYCCLLFIVVVVVVVVHVGSALVKHMNPVLVNNGRSGRQK